MIAIPSSASNEISKLDLMKFHCYKNIKQDIRKCNVNTFLGDEICSISVNICKI